MYQILFFIIKILSFLIPVKSLRKKFRKNVSAKLNTISSKILLKKQYNLYEKIVKSFKLKISEDKKIRVVFLVIFDSVFPARTLFEKMLNDNLFDPKILVIPDTSRGKDNQFNQLKKTYDYLVKLYGKELVINSFDTNRNEFIDYVNDFDMACFANPYDTMTNEFYTIKYYAKNKVLPIYINYGFYPDYYSREYLINLESMNLCWKYFVDTHENYDDVIKYTDIKGKNAILSGYCKMDRLKSIEKKCLEHKKIIIAPHHTVNSPNYPLSNFLKYSDFFLELPKKYPQIDFVFRPHSLLFVTLAKEDFWGKQKVEEYINKMSSFPNVEYQDGGDYFETFVNSSAIIHDCASFIMEYLYTGHPACYMLKNEKEIEKVFAPIGQQCLTNYYHAFNEYDIINFIEDVVITGNDSMRENRINFAKEKIMINYPNAADFIVKTIKEELR